MAAKFVTAGDLEDGRLQVFAIQTGGHLQTRWQESTDPNSAWTPWANFQTPAQLATSLSVGYLSDRRMQLFATDTQGNMVTCWKTGTSPDAGWTQWTDFS